MSRPRRHAQVQGVASARGTVGTLVGATVGRGGGASARGTPLAPRGPSTRRAARRRGRARGRRGSADAGALGAGQVVLAPPEPGCIGLFAGRTATMLAAAVMLNPERRDGEGGGGRRPAPCGLDAQGGRQGGRVPAATVPRRAQGWPLGRRRVPAHLGALCAARGRARVGGGREPRRAADVRVQGAAAHRTAQPARRGALGSRGLRHRGRHLHHQPPQGPAPPRPALGAPCCGRPR